MVHGPEVPGDDVLDDPTTGAEKAPDDAAEEEKPRFTVQPTSPLDLSRRYLEAARWAATQGKKPEEGTEGDEE